MKQNLVALIYVEGEYMVASLPSCEVIWLHEILMRLFDQQLRPTVIYSNN